MQSFYPDVKVIWNRRRYNFIICGICLVTYSHDAMCILAYPAYLLVAHGIVKWDNCAFWLMYSVLFCNQIVLFIFASSVSKHTKVFLQQIEAMPLLDVEECNPSLYKAIPELADIRVSSLSDVAYLEASEVLEKIAIENYNKNRNIILEKKSMICCCWNLSCNNNIVNTHCLLGIRNPSDHFKEFQDSVCRCPRIAHST